MIDPLSYFSFLPSWIGVVAFGDVEMNVKRTSASGHMADFGGGSDMAWGDVTTRNC